MPEPEEYRVVVSKRATQMLVSHAAFVARLDEALVLKLVRDFREAADSLSKMPYRTPTLHSDVFPNEKYRKLIFGKWHLVLYQIKESTVYIEYVIDGRQDYEWLLK